MSKDNLKSGCCPVGLATIILFFVLMSVLMSCTTTKYVPIETITNIREIIRDTITEIRLEKENVRVVSPDTTSTLKTKYATSTAIWRGEQGMLEHSIENTDIPVQVPSKIVEKEVIKEVPKPYPVEVIKKVEKSLSWWETIKMELGGMALGVLIILLVYYGIKLIKTVKLFGWKGILNLILRK